MKKDKEYHRVLLSATAIEKILTEFSRVVKDKAKNEFGILTIYRRNENWHHDSVDEFFADFRKGFEKSHILVRNEKLSLSIWVNNQPWLNNVYSNVSFESLNRSEIERLSNVVDAETKNCLVPEVKGKDSSLGPSKIFIGHGQSPLWRDLKDHLADHHGFEVVAYESGSRAGHSIRDVITEMLNSSCFAVLIMTAEDEMPDGSFRSRQNVIHEIGLFQGRLGFSKAIVLKEDGTEEFSNIHGVNQIRFSKGNIRETFGDVLAVIRREFKNKNR